MDYNKNNTPNQGHKQPTSKDDSTKQPDPKPTDKPVTSHSK